MSEGTTDTDVMGDGDGDGGDLGRRLGELLSSTGRWVGVGESLTGGLLVQALARTQGSGDWLAGGVVADSRRVKHDLLGVSADKVVSRAAEQLASGTRTRLGADVAVAVTGVAGPDDQDGEPPGTVWIAIDDGTASTAAPFRTDGSPEEICDATVGEALRRLVDAVGGRSAG